MFIREEGYARLHRLGISKSRAHINLEGQKHWPPDRSGARGIEIPSRTAYAQNDAYLELCNPGWDLQWRAGIGNLYIILPAILVIWCWYGFAVHPVLFGKIIFLSCSRLSAKGLAFPVDGLATAFSVGDR